MASSHSGDIGTPTARARAKTCSSMKPRAAGNSNAAPDRGTVNVATATFPWKRTITAALPGRSERRTVPSASTSARARSVASKRASAVTSRVDPSA